jgi:hypothetical protein
VRFTWSLKYTVNIPMSFKKQWKGVINVYQTFQFLFYSFQNTRYVGFTAITLKLSTDSSCLGSHFGRRIGSYSRKIRPVRDCPPQKKTAVSFFNCCPSVHVDNHTIITPTKCTLLLLKAPDITVCTLCLIFCPYMFQPAWVIFRGLNASVWLKLLLITVY